MHCSRTKALKAMPTAHQSLSETCVLLTLPCMVTRSRPSRVQCTSGPSSAVQGILEPYSRTQCMQYQCDLGETRSCLLQDCASWARLQSTGFGNVCPRTTHLSRNFLTKPPLAYHGMWQDVISACMGRKNPNIIIIVQKRVGWIMLEACWLSDSGSVLAVLA